VAGKNPQPLATLGDESFPNGCMGSRRAWREPVSVDRGQTWTMGAAALVGSWRRPVPGWFGTRLVRVGSAPGIADGI
jgi:hypothetical protein